VPAVSGFGFFLPARHLVSVCRWRWGFLDLSWLLALVSVCLRRWPLIDLVACVALFVCAFMVLAFP
jgi:hypothetical protein